MLQDLLRRWHIRTTQIGQGDAITKRDLDRELAHIETTYKRYVSAIGGPRELAGLDVFELGNGLTIGVGLRMLAAGARRYTSADKFVPLLDTPFDRQLYAKLRERLPEAERARLDQALQIGANKLELNPEFLRHIHGKDTGELPQLMGEKSQDVIVSNAVLEEVPDLDSCFVVMDRLLRPGGVMVHRIDFGDYGMFQKHGFHPLEFLTVSDGIYRRMVEHSGQPNRRLVDYYRKKMAELGYPAAFQATSVLGVKGELIPPKTDLRKGEDYQEETLEMIRAIRPRLDGEFRGLPDEYLMTRGIVLVARKPK